jgi:hypothetical protein
MIPFLELNVDAEAIAHEATCLARGPKEYVPLFTQKLAKY